MTTHREMAPDMTNNLAAILSNALPPSTKSSDEMHLSVNDDFDMKNESNEDIVSSFQCIYLATQLVILFFF